MTQKTYSLHCLLALNLKSNQWKFECDRTFQWWAMALYLPPLLLQGEPPSLVRNAVYRVKSSFIRSDRHIINVNQSSVSWRIAWPFAHWTTFDVLKQVRHLPAMAECPFWRKPWSLISHISGTVRAIYLKFSGIILWVQPCLAVLWH